MRTAPYAPSNAANSSVGSSLMGPTVSKGIVRRPDGGRSPRMVGSSVAIWTAITALWVAWLGYGAALLRLLASAIIDRVFFVFPLWVLLVGSYILIESLHPPAQGHRRR